MEATAASGVAERSQRWEGAGEQVPRPQPRRAWLVWGVGALCYFVALFHRASLGVAAPDALARFSAGPALLSVLSAVQLGVYLALQIPSGLLADRLGPRKVITAGVLAMAVGSGMFAVSASIAGGVVGRLLIGAGDAFMFTNVLRLAAHWFPARRYGRVAALTGLAGGVGQLVSTVPLTVSLHSYGWFATFAVAAAGTAALGVAAAMVIRDRPVTPGVGALDRHDPGRAGEKVSHALGSVVGLRGTRRAFWMHFVLMAQFVAVTTLWGAPWLTQAQGVTKADAGTLLLVCVLGFVVSAWLTGQFVAGRPGRREVFAVRLSWVVALAWGVLVAWPGRLPLPLLVAVLVVVGVGGGAAMLAFDAARAANEVHRAGAASGVVNMGGFSAAVLIQLVVGVVLQAAGGMPALVAYRWAFLPVLALVVLGTVMQWRLRR